MSTALVRYILTAALRDKLFLSVLVLLAVITSLAVMISSTAVIEADQFALVFTSSSLRLAGNLGLVLFIIFFIRRSFDNGDIDFILSRPVSRPAFIISHSAALLVLSAIVALFCLIALYAVAPHMFGADTMYWLISYFVELAIVTHIALFFSLMLASVPAAAFAVLGFYILGRLIGELLGIVMNTSLFGVLEYLGHLMTFISWFTPRLDLMAQSSWLIYGKVGGVSMGFIFLQGGLFLAILITASIIDLSRKEF